MRKVFSKTIPGSTTGYTLYHTTHLGWGYLYIVDFDGMPATTVAATWPANALAANDPNVQVNLFQGAACPSTLSGISVSITQHVQAAATACGPCLVGGLTAMTPMGCDRTYDFGRTYDAFFSAHPGLILIQDVHDPNDHAYSGLFNTLSSLRDLGGGRSGRTFLSVPWVERGLNVDRLF